MMARSSPTLRIPRLKIWMFWIPCQWRTFPNPCGLCWWVLLRQKWYLQWIGGSIFFRLWFQKAVAKGNLKESARYLKLPKSSYISNQWASLKRTQGPLPLWSILVSFPISAFQRSRLRSAMGWRNPSPKLLRVCRHGGSCCRKEGFGEMKMEPIGLKITPCEVVGKIS